MLLASRLEPQGLLVEAARESEVAAFHVPCEIKLSLSAGVGFSRCAGVAVFPINGPPRMSGKGRFEAFTGNRPDCRRRVQAV